MWKEEWEVRKQCVGSSFQKLAVNECKEMRWLEGSVGTTECLQVEVCVLITTVQ